MFARRKSSVVLLLLFSLVVLLSVSSFSGGGFTACFGFVQQNETSLPASYRRALLQRARCFQPVVLFDLEKTEGENTPVRGASVREESETIFVLSGVLLRVVVQKSALGNVDSGSSAIVSRLRDCVSTRVLRLV